MSHSAFRFSVCSRNHTILRSAFIASMLVWAQQVRGDEVSPTSEDLKASPKNLGDITISAAELAGSDLPIPARTNLGTLTEYTALAGAIISHDEVEALHFVSASTELLPRVPGISMSRNLRFTDGGKNYTENRVDGMRARNTGTFSFVDQVNAGDIERIEFVLGPGSVLSGSNAIGGTINVITRDPPKAREYKLSAESYNTGGSRVSLTAAGPLSKRLGYFVNVNRLDVNGWQTHTAAERTAFSSKWVFRPDAVSKLGFRLEYIEDDSQDPGTLTEAQFNANWRQSQPGNCFRTKIRYTTPSLHLLRTVGDAGELKVFGQLRKTNSISKSALSYSSSGGSISVSDATEKNLQLLYKQGFEPGSSALTGGLDLLGTDTHTKSYVDKSVTTFDFAKGSLSGDSKSKETANSPFLQYEVSPLKALRFTLGAREDLIRYQVDDQLNNAKDGVKDYSRLVKKGGVTYELGRHSVLWANLAEGFLAPSVSTLLGSNAPTPATHAAAVASKYVPTDLSLHPEKSLTSELGIRGSFGRFRYDVALYETKFKDLIVSQLGGSTDLYYSKNVNAASAHAHGVESVLSYDWSRYLEFGVTHTYSIYGYDNYRSGSSNYDGKARYWTPKNHLNLRVVAKPLAGLRTELETDCIDSYYTNQTNTDSYKRPSLVNLRASYGWSQWSLWGQALNVCDSKYAQRISATDAGVRNTYYPGYSPLTFRTGISFQF